MVCDANAEAVADAGSGASVGAALAEHNAQKRIIHCNRTNCKQVLS